MPRKGIRRKAQDMPVTADSNNNDKGINDDLPNAPKNKRSRTQPLQHPLPQRPRVVGKVLACGQGDMGQLGLGDDESKFERKRPALIEKLTNVVDIHAGGMHNIALTHDGRVFTFGCNDEGALGRDSSQDGSEFEPYPTDLPAKVIKISAGDSHSACLLEDGRVFAWGSFRDSHGNMGLTLEGNKRTPIDVMPDVQCCDIASGADHLVILTCRGKVFTVGCGEQGQLGRVSSRTMSGEGRRGKTELLQPCLVVTKGRRPIESIWATNYCTFLREHETGIIWAFGLNNYNQLLVDVKNKETILHPIPTEIDNVKQIVGGQHQTLVLKTDGSVHVIGRKDYGRLGLGSINSDLTELKPVNTLTGKNIVSVACGEAQSFAITADGKLYSWGMGSNNQLGTGSDDDSLVPQLIVSKQTEGKRIIRASGGGQHSIFLVEDENQPAYLEVTIEPKSTNKTKCNAVNWELAEDLDFLPTTSQKRKTYQSFEDKCSTTDWSAAPPLESDSSELQYDYAPSQKRRRRDNSGSELLERVGDLINSTQKLQEERAKNATKSDFAPALEYFDWMLKKLPSHVAEEAVQEITVLLSEKMKQAKA